MAGDERRELLERARTEGDPWQSAHREAVDLVAADREAVDPVAADPAAVDRACHRSALVGAG
jgi:hypothetical protein